LAAQGGVARHIHPGRLHAERQAKSFATPMGDEMFYRYQRSLIDNSAATLKALLVRK
jgi:hypothetical protein